MSRFVTLIQISFQCDMSGWAVGLGFNDESIWVGIAEYQYV